MRPTALPIALGVTSGLQVFSYAVGLPAGTATLGAIMAGCVAYIALQYGRRPNTNADVGRS